MPEQRLDIARYGHIAYLPSDDFFYADHLKDLKEAFESDERVVLAYSGVNFDDTDAYAPRGQYRFADHDAWPFFAVSAGRPP